MFNIYVGKEVEGFHSSADFGYVREFLLDVIEDERYTNFDFPLHLQSNEFEMNLKRICYNSFLGTDNKMALKDYKSKGQLQFHYLSLMNFNQDDGYGNLINTSGMHISGFILEFVYDQFYFVGG